MLLGPQNGDINTMLFNTDTRQDCDGPFVQDQILRLALRRDANENETFQ